MTLVRCMQLSPASLLVGKSSFCGRLICCSRIGPRIFNRILSVLILGCSPTSQLVSKIRFKVRQLCKAADQQTDHPGFSKRSLIIHESSSSKRWQTAGPSCLPGVSSAGSLLSAGSTSTRTSIAWSTGSTRPTAKESTNLESAWALCPCSHLILVSDEILSNINLVYI